MITFSIAILGFLSWRGATNFSLIMLLLPALWYSGEIRRKGLPQGFVPLALAMLSPVLALLVSQLLRQDWIPKAYDGPVRVMLSVPILAWCLHRRVDVARLLGMLAPFALFILVVEVTLDPQSTIKWGGRFATYFVDTDMFGVYVLVLAAFCVFSILPGERISALNWIQLAGFTAGTYLIIGSQTRTAYIGLMATFLLWFFLHRRNLNRRMLLRVGVALLVLVVCLLLVFPATSARILSIYHEISAWMNGSSRDTSGGLRLTMWGMSWELFKHSPWVGYGDTGFRSLLNEPWITSIASEEARNTIFNGPHNEFLANLLRSGIWGGFRCCVCSWCLRCFSGEVVTRLTGA